MTKQFLESARLAATSFYKWLILTTQTHTICRGALRFATQISPLLNFNTGRHSGTLVFHLL